MNLEDFDFLVIGSGLAGLSFALRAAQFGTVCVLTKGDVSDSNTSWAQGGIAAAVGEADSWEMHERDTLIAGAGLCDEEAVRFLVQNAPRAIEWLIGLGANFDQNDGGLALGREGGHSMNRIVHHQDRTGWEVERAVVAAVRANSRIQVYQHTFVTALAKREGRCVGATAFVSDVGVRHFRARATLLATGGCGRMYQHTTNPTVATADGIALADAIGAEIRHMEFMQFHPTTLFHPQMRSFLITEAVRGVGGTLRNHLGRRFMYDYDDRLELAPRDIVARAIETEIAKHGTWCVYLDVTHLSPHLIKEEFPTIYNRLRSIGLEIEKEWIPVVPAQHYSCGGVVTDLDGQTTLSGLYAAGEVACTGVHGANRLASNSLLEAMVFATAAADAAPREPALKSIAWDRSCWSGDDDVVGIPEAESIRIRRALQRTMMQNAAIVRSSAGLSECKETVTSLERDYESQPVAPFSQHSLGTANLLQAAHHVIDGAISRQENIGLHFNRDLIKEPLLNSEAVPLP